MQKFKSGPVADDAVKACFLSIALTLALVAVLAL
jgi:hypothetical protein